MKGPLYYNSILHNMSVKFTCLLHEYRKEKLQISIYRSDS